MQGFYLACIQQGLVRIPIEFSAEIFFGSRDHSISFRGSLMLFRISPVWTERVMPGVYLI